MQTPSQKPVSPYPDQRGSSASSPYSARTSRDSGSGRGRGKSKGRKRRGGSYDDVNGSGDNGFSRLLNWVALAFVKVVSTPIIFAAKILEQFVNGEGRLALGALALALGVLLGADNFHQLGGFTLFPIFTDAQWVGERSISALPGFLSWLPNVFGGRAVVGFWAVISTVFSFSFLFCILLSFLTQSIQGRVIRGKSLASAQAEFNKFNVKAPAEPGEEYIAQSHISWKQVKNTGRNRNRFSVFISVSLSAAEAIGAFSARNPLDYTGQPLALIGCTTFALLSIVAGEVGYVLWCDALADIEEDKKLKAEQV